MNPHQNLDYLAATHAQELIQHTQNPKDIENSLTKTLGVLQENGVYACFLYLYAREKNTGKEIAAAALKLFAALQLPTAPNASQTTETLTYIAQHITNHLPTLLLAKEALEQMLIYARYHAKAADTP